MPLFRIRVISKLPADSNERGLVLPGPYPITKPAEYGDIGIPAKFMALYSEHRYAKHWVDRSDDGGETWVKCM